MLRTLCSFHRTGVPYPFVKTADFFQRGCRVCAAKLKAGIVNGTEPPPPSHDNPAQQMLLKRLRKQTGGLFLCRECGNSYDVQVISACDECGSESSPIHESQREDWGL